MAFCRDSIWPTLPAPQAHATYAMIGILVEDQRRPIAGWKDVGFQVHKVDLSPDTATLGNRLLIGEAYITMEIRCRIAESCVAKGEEPCDVPLLDIDRIGIDIDGEVEIVRDECTGGAPLEDVEALDDEDVGPCHPT